MLSALKRFFAGCPFFEFSLPTSAGTAFAAAVDLHLAEAEVVGPWHQECDRRAFLVAGDDLHGCLACQLAAHRVADFHFYTVEAAAAAVRTVPDLDRGHFLGRAEVKLPPLLRLGWVASVSARVVVVVLVGDAVDSTAWSAAPALARLASFTSKR